MNNDEETDLRAKLTAMKWNDLRKEAKNSGVKANMKKALMIDALVHKITTNDEASSSVEILGSFNNSAESKNRSVGSGGVVKTGRTFKYVPVFNLAQDDTGDLANDEAAVPDVSAKKLSFFELQDEESMENETGITDGKELQLNLSADVRDNSIQNLLISNDEDLKQNGALNVETDKPDEVAEKNDADLMNVTPILCSEPSKKENHIDFTEDESSSLSDEDTQLNTTYDVPQNDGDGMDEELGTIVGSAEPVEVDSFVEAKEKKSADPINENIFDADEPLVNFEAIEGAIEKSSEGIKANDSLMLCTSTPLFDHKSLPPIHTFGSVIHNPFSEKFPAEVKPVEVAGQQLGLGTLAVIGTPTVKDQLALVAAATPTFDSKVVDSVSTATSQFSFPAKLTPSSVNFKFGNVATADIAKVQKVSQPKSILKRSFMSANRTYSMQNPASVKMDVKRRTIQASKSRSNRLSRVASAPGTGGKFKAMESPKMRFIDLNSTVGGGSSGREEFRKSQDRSLTSRDRSSVSRVYTPYSGPFRYKDTSKMRDDELKKYNLEKSLKRREHHDDSKNRIF